MTSSYQWNSDAEVAFPTFLMGIVGFESISEGLSVRPANDVGIPFPRTATGFGQGNDNTQEIIASNK